MPSLGISKSGCCTAIRVRVTYLMLNDHLLHIKGLSLVQNSRILLHKLNADKYLYTHKDFFSPCGVYNVKKLYVEGDDGENDFWDA